jgi:hypothetical protein
MNGNVHVTMLWSRPYPELSGMRRARPRGRTVDLDDRQMWSCSCGADTVEQTRLEQAPLEQTPLEQAPLEQTPLEAQ